jgi:hypothetical protein
LRSEEVSVLEGVHELDGCLGDIDDARLSRLLRKSLGVHLDTLGLGLSLLGVVLAHSSLEGLTALALADMLDSDVNSLGDDSASVLLVDDDSDGVLGHIEHTTGLAVVEFVGHALVDGTVGNDVDEIALSVSLHDLGKVDGAVVSEALAEEVSSSCSVSEAVRHLYFLIVK